MKAVVIAFGTRGDVQPLTLLAAGLASRSIEWSAVVLVTHDQHHAMVRSLLNRSRVDVATVDSPPVLWKGTPGSSATEERATLAQQNGCVEACRGAHVVIFNMFALEGYHVSEAFSIPCVVCHPYLTASPMPSSFPSRLRRTYPRLYRRLTRVPGSDTARSLPKKRCERKAAALGSNGDERSVRSDAAERRGGRAETAWDHVEHWMWPLFTDKWGDFRERLGLPPCPLQQDLVGKFMEPRGETFSVADNDNLESLKTIDIDPAQLPLVLYLFSPLVVDSSPFWPERVRVCGYLFSSPATHTRFTRFTLTHAKRDRQESHSPSTRQRPAPSSREHELNPTPTLCSNEREDSASEKRLGMPPDVEAFLSAREDRPIYVGFGSMWGMCLPGYRLAFALRVLLLGARQAGARCLVHLPDSRTPREAWATKNAFDGAGEGEGGSEIRLRELEAATEWLEEFATSSGQEDLLVHREPLDHGGLLPRCSIAIHHGGSGTTAAVLRAGIPHVVCPQHLDQFFWAERVRYLAVGSVLERSLFIGHGPAPIEPPGSLVCLASAAIASALTPQVKLRAACLGVKIRAENGLENALDALFLFLRKRSTTRTVPHHRPNDTATALPHSVTTWPTSAQVADMKAGTIVAVPGGQDRIKKNHARGGKRGLSASADDISDQSCPGVVLRKDSVEEKLVLREMPNGLRIWWASRAEEEAFFIYGEVFEDRTYARMNIRVQDGDTVWDVGANVGLASIFFELEADTPDSLHVYAFEPLPLNRTALKRNLSMHCPTAVVVEYALGAKHEDGVDATFYPRMPGNSTFRPLEKERLQGKMGRTRGETGETFSSGRVTRVEVSNSKGTFFDDAEQVSCSVRTMSWVMYKLGVDRIDLLKVDVEGAELDVLLGIENHDWPKIKQVVVEVHPVGDRVTRMCDMLRYHGFNVSAQALGLDGTPISPSRGLNADIADSEAGAIVLSHSAKTCSRGLSGSSPDRAKANVTKGTKGNQSVCPPKEWEDGDNNKYCAIARIHQGECRADGNSRGNDDHQEAGDGRGCWGDGEALDGMVFMVYAKRL